MDVVTSKGDIDPAATVVGDHRRRFKPAATK
jgi:hypothetical protein